MYLDVNGEADISCWLYLQYKHLRHNFCKSPNMLTYLLTVFPKLYSSVRQCFPCENITINVGYYF